MVVILQCSFMQTIFGQEWSKQFFECAPNRTL